MHNSISENQDSIKLIRKLDSVFSIHKKFIANSFDYPVGENGNAKGYFVGRPFWTKKNHLGEDWGELNDPHCGFGKPILSIANGYVIFAGKSTKAWGNVVMIAHFINSDSLKYIQSLYGHLNEISVNEGDLVKKNQQIGTMGDANGVWVPHLHFEIRSYVSQYIGGGYGARGNDSWYLKTFLAPSEFIKKHRN